MLYALAGLCLALVAVIPVCLAIVLEKVLLMHKRTLDLIEDTQLVQGTPAHLIEHKHELVRERQKDATERQIAAMPRLADKVRF